MPHNSANAVSTPPRQLRPDDVKLAPTASAAACRAVELVDRGIEEGDVHWPHGAQTQVWLSLSDFRDLSDRQFETLMATSDEWRAGFNRLVEFCQDLDGELTALHGLLRNTNHVDPVAGLTSGPAPAELTLGAQLHVVVKSILALPRSAAKPGPRSKAAARRWSFEDFVAYLQQSGMSYAELAELLLSAPNDWTIPPLANQHVARYRRDQDAEIGEGRERLIGMLRVSVSNARRRHAASTSSSRSRQ